jgi:hypothetical protein
LTVDCWLAIWLPTADLIADLTADLIADLTADLTADLIADPQSQSRLGNHENPQPPIPNLQFRETHRDPGNLRHMSGSA